MKKMMIIAIAILLVNNAAVFAETGEAILTKVENALSGPKDYECRAVMVLADMNGSNREQRELKLWLAGKDSRVIKFLSPAGIEGIGLLTEGDEGMYLYLPAQNRIRMIEGSVKDQSFQGTDFSYNEMGSYEYKKDYTSEITKEDAGSWTLRLVKKAGSDRAYDQMVMVVNKENYIPVKVELYEKNVLKKVLLMQEVRQFGKYLLPVKIRVENLAQNHYTEMYLEDIVFDQGLEAQGVFTKRFLKKRVQ
ncbi:MAG: outer membrane lipoprotein-sorting protein [Spirochaetales bacterium]|nr:outer membrane lipoprotein-sorting protein [Spirochaetales bacterium]